MDNIVCGRVRWRDSYHSHSSETSGQLPLALAKLCLGKKEQNSLCKQHLYSFSPHYLNITKLINKSVMFAQDAGIIYYIFLEIVG